MEGEGSAAELIIQMLPAFIICIIYAVLIYITARKRGVNPWPWVIPTLIPFIGWIVGGVFFFVTTLSILDRLNVLEGRDGPA